jgi:hypothetical protein
LDACTVDGCDSFESDRGFLDGLSEDTFWEFLRFLVKGRTHSGKDRAKELVTYITGIPDGGVQPIKEKHVRLQNAHDLPRYLLHMKHEEAVRGYGEGGAILAS